MKHPTLETVKRSALAATTFFLVFAGLSSGYAALTSGLSASDRASSGSTLSAAGWNKIVDSVIELDGRTAPFSVVSGNVGVDVAAPGTKLHVNGAIRSGNTIQNVFTASLPADGGSYSTAPLHLKTNWVCWTTANVMYNLEFKGLNFMSNTQIDAQAVGYLYGSFGHTYNSTTKHSGFVTVSTYCSAADNKLVFKLTSTYDWHASDLVVNFIGGGSWYLKNGADTLQFISAVHSATNI